MIRARLPFWRSHGFTLVELLVVIGIIAVLIGILLPVLSRCREAANVIRCSSNLRCIGQGIAAYVVDYKGFLPASNFWKGLHILPGVQLPPTPSEGYIHWSSYLYSRKDLNDGTDNIFRSLAGWDAFQCPSIPDGGLPATNTFPGNSSLPNESSNTDPDTNLPVVDAQAPRLAYTVNEALCPRGFFVQGAIVAGNMIQRPYRFVRAASVQHSGDTILASEMWGNQTLMAVDSLMSPEQGIYVSGAHRPVSGYESGLVGAEFLWQLPLGGPYAWLFPINRAIAGDLSPDPSATAGVGSTPKTTLDWVGRNHGPHTLDSSGFDTRKSNFLYLDGHVETKTLRDTLTPAFQWGDQFYSLTGGDNIQ